MYYLLQNTAQKMWQSSSKVLIQILVEQQKLKLDLWKSSARLSSALFS